MQLKDLGERAAIDRIWDIIGVREKYDDCVYIKEGDFYKLYTTDFIGENTHFLRSWSPNMIGKFFASINLSDIAAMGGLPQFFMASMSFPRNIEVEFVEDLVKGIKEILKLFNVPYKGGDFKESINIGMSGFVVGYVEKNRILRRDTFDLRENVYVTGQLGKQAAGYILWKNGFLEGVRYLLEVYPRVREGREISKNASACMDLSDGLLAAVRFLKNEKYGIKIDFDEIPIHKLAYEVSEDYKIPLEFLVTTFGGEYELVYTSSTKIIGKEIGNVTDRENSGIWKGVKKIEGEGYAHFGKILDKT